VKTLLRIGLPFFLFAQLNLSGFAQSSIITTYAGIGTQGFSGDGGPATAAQLSQPSDVTVDSLGNLYIADIGNIRIRKVTKATGEISTVAGSNASRLGDGGRATSAMLLLPGGVALDSAENLYIADGTRIRKVTKATGIISTVAGTGIPGFSGDGGPATAAMLHGAAAVTFDSAGNLYIADKMENRIRKVTASTGIISTVAGTGTPGFSGDGGAATEAMLYQPIGMTFDSAGNLYIADQINCRIRKVTPDGTISTVAGGGNAGLGDGGPARGAILYTPTSVTLDSVGDLYIADGTRIRKVTASTGIIETVAGGGSSGLGDEGPATSAQLNGAMGLAIDSERNLYTADSQDHRIRKVTGMGPLDTFFPQVAVGGGYTTLFAITNTGSTTAAGSLILRDMQGSPMSVNGTLTDSSGITRPTLSGDSFPITVPSGGTIFFSAASLSSNGPIETGWAKLASAGGLLTGVATYEYAVDSITQYMVGVLQTQPIQYATIPVDIDSSQDKQIVYAIANPSKAIITIYLALIAQDGSVVDDTVTITLNPGQQIAQYMSQALERTNFKGTVVLRGQAGASFVAITLLTKQGLFTVIPLISGKAPGVPD
jgi:hypothetical protein